MLLTIFGAGASYDSVDLDVVPSLREAMRMGARPRPPLANELFDERPEFVEAMNKYPQMSAIVPRLRRASQSGLAIEATLRDIQAEADSFPQRRSHLMALEFYLSDILNNPVSEWLQSAGRATNYVELLDQIERNASGDPLLFVTFNYDRMLESAFSDLMGKVFRDDDLTSYIPQDFALIKPHGSVDWAQFITVEAGRLARMERRRSAFGEWEIINNAPNLDFRHGEIGLRPSRGGTVTGDLWHPAIAIPLDQGKTFICPPSHLDRLSHDLEKVTHVLIIGWRAGEQHFLAMLRERLPKGVRLNLCIVDKDDGAEATLWNLRGPMGSDVIFEPVELHKDGFSAFVVSGRVRGWLRRS